MLHFQIHLQVSIVSVIGIAVLRSVCKALLCHLGRKSLQLPQTLYRLWVSHRSEEVGSLLYAALLILSSFNISGVSVGTYDVVQRSFFLDFVPIRLNNGLRQLILCAIEWLVSKGRMRPVFIGFLWALVERFPSS